MQVRNYWDIAGSVRQILKDLALDSLNLLLLPADGSMETIRVSNVSANELGCICKRHAAVMPLLICQTARISFCMHATALINSAALG